MLKANRGRIERRIARLAEITTDLPYTRRAFTDTYLRGRNWLRAEMERVGLSVHLDDGANLIGSRAGPQSGSWMLGSHTDTVPAGGRFDGIAGVIAALEVAQVLYERGHPLQHGLEIVDFLSEEPSDYGASCVGSRAMAGTLTPPMRASTNPDGEALADAIRRMGGRPDELNRPLRPPGSVRGYLELHIEQGPVLERANTDVGIVEGIVAIERHRVTLTGRADHAGTTPMQMRRDALVAAAHLVQHIQQQALRESERYPFVATVGVLHIEPNVSNVVPSRVQFVFEARSMNDEALKAFCLSVIEAVRDLCVTNELLCETEQVSFARSANSNVHLFDALMASADALGYSYQRMPSGAGHDAMQVANFAPVGMLFVPCRDGKSHTSEEYATTEQIARGADVLLHAVLQLDQQAKNR